MATLKADLRVGESIRIEGSGSARLTLIAKSGQRARFEIERDNAMNVHLPQKTNSLDVIRLGINPPPRQKLTDTV
jgi:hypothetical protein